MSISVLILTLNEEANLPTCLRSLAWCDDVVVVDSFSSDGTTVVAEAAGARLLQRKFDNFAGQRNYALDNVAFRHDWVLHLDADEVVTDALHAEMQHCIVDERYDAYRLPSKTMFFGKWLKYSGMYPTYQVRLGRASGFRFKQVGHGQREDIDPARVGTLKEPYLHYSFSKGLGDWFEKHNRYSSQEAAEMLQANGAARLDVAGLFSLNDRTRRRRALKAFSCRLPFRPVLRFFYMYVVRLGFLDGRVGYRYCRLLAIYEAMIDMKVRELRRRDRGLPV